MIVYASFEGQGFPTGFYLDAFYPAAGADSMNPAIPAGAVAITEAQWADCLAHQGLRQWVNGVLQPYAPPAVPPPAPTVTGNQWAFPLSDLGLSSAWRIGVTKSKDSDQVRVSLIARDTPLVAADPLLIRVAANAGTDGSGNPLIAVPAVFAHAQGMPL